MFIPNNRGTYTPQTGFNVTGETAFGASRTVPCGIVEITGDLKRTPPRAGASASRGNSDEDVATAVILFPARLVTPKIGDRFIVAGLDLRFVTVEPRYGVIGGLDHFECTFEAWPT